MKAAVKLSDRTRRHPETLKKAGYHVELLSGKYEVEVEGFATDQVDVTSVDKLKKAIFELVRIKHLWSYKTPFMVMRKDGEYAVVSSVPACARLEALLPGSSAFVGKPVKEFKLDEPREIDNLLDNLE